MEHKWNGDVDLGDGALKKLFDEYIDRRRFIEALGISQSKQVMISNCSILKEWINTDLAFIRESNVGTW